MGLKGSWHERERRGGVQSSEGREAGADRGEGGACERLAEACETEKAAWAVARGLSASPWGPGAFRVASKCLEMRTETKNRIQKRDELHA